MSPLSCYADSVIASLEEHCANNASYTPSFPNQIYPTVTDPSLLSLQSILPRSLVLAALDLIDRENVLKCIGPARQHYELLGSTATYYVYLDLPDPISAYCTCPAFTFLVLSSESYLMVGRSIVALLPPDFTHSSASMYLPLV
ncbi:hypothetical protein C8R43DRAFT_1133362 [Mycena crocata]|nr:hypothetical protein C8R43DRAFT_1133362 [Mycena crocata]